MIKCVIFDMDGTIGNTLPLCITAFRQSIQAVSGKVFSDREIIDTFGPSEEGTIMALIPEHYDEGIIKYQEQYKKLHHSITPEPFSGIREVFQLIRNNEKHLALVTGKARRSLDITLAVFAMEKSFDVIETGIPFGPNKPHGIKSVLDKLHIKPENAIYIGDTVSDITAARSIGVPIFSAAWDRNADVEALKESKPDELFYTVNELYLFLKNNLSLY